MIDVLYLFYDVVIKLKFLQAMEGVEILNLKDVCFDKMILRKESDSTLILPKLICGSLGIILFSLR